jgi:D-alanyl-D-alanine carboxypeptidase/D-alanyl-D-alanine-endopeptidase (penicillin-binding protein 4)
VRRLLAICLALMLALTSHSAFAMHTIEKRATASALSSPGLLFMDSAEAKVLSENKPDSLRIPASVLKLLTSLVAIENLGSETRFTTSVFSMANNDEILIRGSKDPFLTTSRAIADKYGHKYLPYLVSKGNPDNLKRIKIFYEGLYPKDIYNLSVAMKNRKIKAKFIEVSSGQAEQIGRNEIASLTSLPISKMIEHLTLWSDNLVADRLASAAARKVGNPTTGKGLTATYKVTLEALGIRTEGLKIRDGSGLSKSNQVSARMIVDALMLIRRDPKFKSIYDGLPVAGESGTLVKRFEKAPEAKGNVRAKTGWVSNSVTLAGYVKSGEKEYAFAILADGITPSLKYRNRARAAMDKLLETIVKGDH